MSGIILLPALETLSKEAIYKDAKIASSGMRLMFRVVTSLFTGARGTDWPE